MNALVMGQRRQGKSTLALAYTAWMEFDTVVIWDPNWNYRHPAIDRINAADVHEWMLYAVRRAEQGVSLQICAVGPLETDDLDDQFKLLIDTLKASDWQDYALIVDESPMLQKPAKMHPSLDKLWRSSTPDILVIQTAHRFYELHTNSRFHADEILAFRNDLPREVDVINKTWGEGIGSAISHLEDREFLHIRRGNAGRIESYRVNSASSWYVDLRNPNRRTRETPQTRKAAEQAISGTGEGSGAAARAIDIANDGDDGKWSDTGGGSATESAALIGGGQ